MDRKLYKGSFTLENFPDYICPRCNKGLLRIEKDSFNSIEPLDSKIEQEDARSEPDWIYYVFNCMFKCTNDRCADIVMCTGSGGVDCDIDVDMYGHQSQEWYSYYRPLFFHPNLKLITIPKDTPTNIEKILNQSFELFFTSPSAAANLVRIFLEEILTDQEVKQYTTNKKGESVKLNLDSRIKHHLPDKYQTIKEHFEAVKWLGNAGSHSGKELSLDDAMDAYELVEYVLSKIYYSPSDNLDRLAQEINSFKGPKKKKFV